MFLQLIVVGGAAVVLFMAVSSITRMTASTNHAIRAAFVMIAAGAFGEMLAILQSDHSPGISEILFVGGYGLLNFVDRRAMLRCPFVPQLTDKG